MSSTNYTISGTTDIIGAINEFATGSSFAVNIKSPSLSSNIDFTLPPTAPSSNQLLQRTGASSLGWVTPSTIITGKSLPVLYNYSSGDLSISGRLVTLGQFGGTFIFSGTNIETPTSFSIVATTPAGNSFTATVRDFTNGSVVICTINFPAGVTTGIVSTTTFTNLPPTQAIFELTITALTGASSRMFSTLMY
jgi:hypothetical protein